MIQIKDVDKIISDLRYELDRWDRTFSDRGKIVNASKSLMEPCYVTMWMIMYPLKGQECTITKNISDLSGWIEQIVLKCLKHKVTILQIFEELSDSYLRKIKTELQNHHGYPSLIGKSGFEISQKMADIFSKVSTTQSDKRKKNKNYVISRQEINDIIKSELDIE